MRNVEVRVRLVRRLPKAPDAMLFGVGRDNAILSLEQACMIAAYVLDTAVEADEELDAALNARQWKGQGEASVDN
jgi:hypothetical protein